MWLSCTVAGYCRSDNLIVLSWLSWLVCYIPLFLQPCLCAPLSYVYLGCLSYVSGLSLSPFWAGAVALLIWTMHEPRHINSVQNCAFNAPQNCSTQATLFMSGPMSDLLHGSVGDTCFLDASSTGYQNSRSALGSDLYLNECNSNFQTHLDLPTQSPHLWLPFDQQRDTTPHQPDSYPHDLTGLAYMQSQVSAFILLSLTLELTRDLYEALLCQASVQELIASQNSAYMQLYKDNIKLMGCIESLEYDCRFSLN
jgi:hypothetical protein